MKAAGTRVVKFGGSLLAAPERAALLAAAARRRAIVVPGGGAFADTVRAAQAKYGFSDRAAHMMAISAMDQTALLLADAAPDLALCSTPDDFAAAEATDRAAIWRPSPMALSAELPASWVVTSDSLALWLALTLEAERLVLLKAAHAPPAIDLEGLAQASIVDRHFPVLARGFAGEIVILAPATGASLEAVLAGPQPDRSRRGGERIAFERVGSSLVRKRAAGEFRKDGAA